MASLEELGRFPAALPPGARLWFVESNGAQLYSDIKYASADFLVFGRETAGLPAKLLAEHADHWLRIPMFNAQSRSLNLANCVALSFTRLCASRASREKSRVLSWR